MSKQGAEAILNARMAETRQRKAALAAQVEADKEAKTYVIENPEAPAGESRTSRAFGRVHSFQSGADVRTGLGDPRLAVWLYIALVSTAVMFSSKWGQIVGAVTTGVKR